MILQFKVKNFLSIREEQTLDFTASADKTYEDYAVVKIKVFAFPSWVLFTDQMHLARATSSKLWLGLFSIWLPAVPRSQVLAQDLHLS